MSTLAVISAIFIGLLMLVGILFSAVKMSEKSNGTESSKKWREWGDYAINHGYFVPIALLVSLSVVLWLTNHKLGWGSFMVRDRWTFLALMVTYFVIVTAFIQDKDKRKNAPFYQKAMVVAMVLAVEFALIGNMLWGHLPSWPWPGTGSAQANIQPAAQVVPSQFPLKQQQTIKVVAEQGIFKEVVIPDGYQYDLHCPPNTFMGATHRGLPQGKVMDCDEDIKISLGDNLRDLRFSFISTDAVPKTVIVTLKER